MPFPSFRAGLTMAFQSIYILVFRKTPHVVLRWSDDGRTEKPPLQVPEILSPTRCSPLHVPGTPTLPVTSDFFLSSLLSLVLVLGFLVSVSILTRARHSRGVSTTAAFVNGILSVFVIPVNIPVDVFDHGTLEFVAEFIQFWKSIAMNLMEYPVCTRSVATVVEFKARVWNYLFMAQHPILLMAKLMLWNYVNMLRRNPGLVMISLVITLPFCAMIRYTLERERVRLQRSYQSEESHQHEESEESEESQKSRNETLTSTMLFYQEHANCIRKFNRKKLEHETAIERLSRKARELDTIIRSSDCHQLDKAYLEDDRRKLLQSIETWISSLMELEVANAMTIATNAKRAQDLREVNMLSGTLYTPFVKIAGAPTSGADST